MLQENLNITDRAAGPFAAGGRSGLSHFLLISQNSSVRFAADACVAVLQCANRFAKSELFTWEHAGQLDALAERKLLDMAGTGLVLVGGLEQPWGIGQADQPYVKSRLQTARHLCVVGSGIFVPLAAGCLDGKAVSVHPNFRAAVSEMTYSVDISDHVISHSNGLSSAIGGMAAAPMMLDIVGQRVGAFTQQAVAEYLGLCRPRQGTISHEHWRYIRKSQGNQVIADALAVMLENLEDVLSTRAVASAVNVSPRHLERCCKSYLRNSPMKVYRDLRLARAHQLLVQTNLAISEISVASGFPSASSLAKWYRGKYGELPVESRRHAFCSG